MVWKPKKSRRSGSRGTVAPHESVVGRNLRSCLKASHGGDMLYVNQSQLKPMETSERDHSLKSGRSFLSAISGSGSSKSRDTADDHGRGNTSLGSVDSVASRSSLLMPVVSRVPIEAKQVRFGNILIREHERVVGDNPSCSTGPPISLGWGHFDKEKILIDTYEEKRAYRKGYRKGRIVLSRTQREDILLKWNIAFEDIIDAIRANIRIKNQRRQTVTNLGKADRFEEALEGATRRIKRALLLRRSTNRKVKQLQEQAEVAAKLHSPSSSVSDEQRHSSSDGKVEKKASLADKTGAREADDQSSSVGYSRDGSSEELMRAASVLSDMDDLRTSMSDFSYGNSTTASARELEQFYMDLEREMFGDVPLPDMVGETLEVPGVSIPKEERVYFDPPSVAGRQEPPSVTPSDYKEETEPAFTNAQTGPLDTNLVFHDDPLTAIRMGKALPPEIPMVSEQSDFSQGLVNTAQRNSDQARAYLSEAVTAMEQRYLHPSLAPPLPPPYGSAENFTINTGNGGSIGHSENGRSRSRRRSRGRKEEPIVCHIPPFTKWSPSHWMDGHDDSPIKCCQAKHEIVIITEDPGCDHRILPSPVGRLSAIRTTS